MSEEKKFLDGIQVSTSKRSIKDIPVPHRHKTNHPKSTVIIEEKENMVDFVKKNKNDKKEEIESDIPLEPQENNKNPFWIYFSILFVVVFLIFLGFSVVFSKAIVAVTPKNVEIDNLNIDLPVIDEKSQNTELLNYKVLDIEEKSNKIVDSESEEEISSKSTGIITIYNEFNTTGQKLIQNTRFESPEGLIYRIQKSVNVPGYTEKNGQKIAGSVDAEVIADQAGEKYNITKTDFKIPGFKNQAQYNLFYAKSKTDMTGGFSGKKNTVSKDTFDKDIKILQGEITDKILKKLKELAKSENYVYIYSPEKFEFFNPNQNNTDNKKVEISLSGKASIYIIEKDKLAQKIAEKEIRDYQNNPIKIENFDQLNISMKEENVTAKDEVIQSNKIINITGNPKFVWQNDFEKLKSELAGKKRADLLDVIAEYPGISKANATLDLILNNNFPKNPQKIEIKLE